MRTFGRENLYFNRNKSSIEWGFGVLGFWGFGFRVWVKGWVQGIKQLRVRWFWVLWVRV